MHLLKRSFPALLLIIIAVTLLNSNAFGAHTFIAYFLYCVLSALAAVWCFGYLLLRKNRGSAGVPAYAIALLAFAGYVVVHGIVNGGFGLTHYYWIGHACFFVSLLIWNNGQTVATGDTPGLSRAKVFLYRGIAVIASAEAMVVLLQCMGLFPVPNKNFLCTGTWINPNVTAMFLSLSLAVILQSKQPGDGRFLRIARLSILFLVTAAIAALMSRSAYIATAIILGFEYYTNLKTLIKKNLRFNLNGVALALAVFIIVQMLMMVFAGKQGSTKTRLQVWRTSLELVEQHPLTGVGFGGFEKNYNLFAEQKALPVNDHVNMAYNDFVELAVEGGVPAILLWILFLSLLMGAAYRQRKTVRMLLPVTCSFIVLQLTNFGFQAIPAMAIFILYIAVNDAAAVPVARPRSVLLNFTFRRVIPVAGLAAAVVAFSGISGLMNAFYTKWTIGATPAAERLQAYRRLENRLDGYALFHEGYGDALLQQQKIEPALRQYQAALESTSSPDVFAKLALCYQLLGNYDSSEANYMIVQQMQPHRFLPRLALLRLYQEQKDNEKVYAKASEIMSMPVKVRSKKVADIKLYAKGLLKASPKQSPDTQP